MKVEALTTDRIWDFIAYCKEHRMEIDDSFLYDKDLRKFEPNAENPTYIVTNERGDIIAAASLIINDYFRRGKKARFRIFHSEKNDFACFEMLMKAILKHAASLDTLFLYVPVTNETLADFLERLNFQKDRYAFLLVREDKPVPARQIPDGYSIRTFKPGQDEEAWCEIRNKAFANLKGSETPITPEMVANLVASEDFLEGGMKILEHGKKPVGIIRCSHDTYEDAPIMNIGPLAILPEHQGQGLGRILLREALRFAKEKSYKRTVLSANGENERAVALYIREGFRQVEAVACYTYNL